MAGGTTADENKKAVCKAFTSVVKSSVLAVDPKAFFMMLMANYAVLIRDGRMDLGPLWDSMIGQHPKEQLYGVFLMFRQRAMDLGLKVLLPKAVDALSEDEMRQAMQPWTGLMIPDEPTPYEPIAIPLSTGDIKPFIPEETKRQIVQIVSSAIRQSPIGAKFDAAQLTFQISSAFEALFDGRSFDFAQIFEVLRQSEPLEDREVYLVVARAKAELSKIGVGVREPEVALNTIEKQNIIDVIRREDERSAKQRSSSGAPSDGKQQEETSARPTTEERLKEYGLESVNEKVKKTSIVRPIALALVVVIAGVTAFLLRPDRELDHEHYASIIPMTSARLSGGSFQCVVDETRWLSLSVEEREQRLGKLQAILHDEGLAADMQCRDTKNNLVLSATPDGRILGATFFMKGAENVTVPNAPFAGKK